MQRDITKMPVEELKGLAYDHMIELNRIQANIEMIQRQLVEKSKEMEGMVEAEKVEAKGQKYE